MVFKQPRRVFGMAFAAVAIVLAMASTAYACTTYKGQMTISQTGQTSKTNIGGDSGMTYCGGAASQVMTLDDASQYTITVAKQTGSSCPASLGNLLFSTNYDINKTSAPGVGDCMSGDADATKITTMSVSTGGAGNKTLNGSTLDAGTTALCVSSSGGGTGNQMSVAVI